MAKNGREKGPILESGCKPSILLTVCFEDRENLSKLVGSKEGASREEEVEETEGILYVAELNLEVEEKFLFP